MIKKKYFSFLYPKKIVLIGYLLFYFSGASVFAQKTPTKTRILFLLDASGSMKEKWGKEIKFVSAQKVINQMVDSLKQEPNVEIAIRVFGHQFPKKDKNCNDTKLELDFNPSSFNKMRKTLENIVPKGYTPIALSLNEAIKDFGKSNTKNIIILVTDGVENCEGDPCEASANLEKSGIFLKPYIVGLGLSETQKKIFECVGEMYDIKEEKSTQKITEVIISNVLNPTTLQINLLDDYGKATETNLNMSFFDSQNKQSKYNIYHTINASGVPDTLFVDPLNSYDVKIHSIPSVEKKGIKLTRGKHTIEAIEVPQGAIKINIPVLGRLNSTLVRVQKMDEVNSLNYQNINSLQMYLTGWYTVEVLSLPIIRIDSVKVNQGKITSFTFPAPGNLNYSITQLGIFNLFLIKENGMMEKIYSNEMKTMKDGIAIQPGNYLAVYKNKNTTSSSQTQENRFSISSGLSVNIKF